MNRDATGQRMEPLPPPGMPARAMAAASGHRMKSIPPGSVRRAWPRFGAWLCLTALLSGQVQLFPALLALAAMSDPSHKVVVGLQQGEFTLVLRHETGRRGFAGYNPRRDGCNAAHRHGLLARCVCAFSSATDHTLDHIACFPASLVAEDSPAGVVPKAKACDQPSPLDAGAGSLARPSPTPRLPRREAQSPTRCQTPLRFLHSVSLRL